ncbi:glycosyltransferase [Paenibacillus sp. Soil787]|uniref:glycosyltransferase n=1 Tax=Paenibacillus sp. Soil787 TaxID=1736411 RepID=UPI000702AEE8|nr:glycosyltransferase family A protein [Paenibacillus sp. Soil787]KRF09894.1 glycosyl transferase family 2 [Paenibacillus sp. Soil787]
MSKKKRGVSIITCTNRPSFISNVLANYKRQRYPIKELIIVLNKSGMKLSKYRKKAKDHKNVSVYRRKEKVSLGECLNYAIKRTKLPYIAKFDDDDYYSKYYLTEQMKALRRSKAHVVGKRAYLAFIKTKKLLVLHTPKKQHKFVTWVTGGTILFKRRVFNKVRFPKISLNEDVIFAKRCRKNHFKIYSSSPYNYVMIRRKNKKGHTWKASDDHLLSRSQIVAKTRNFRKMGTRAK